MSEAGSRLYDEPLLAAAYARVSAANAANAAYERPALRALLDDVAGRDVLDAGCAAGEHAQWLGERGARVVALDASEAMVALARERLGERARVLRADLDAPLPLETASFDLVVSSLTLHYLRDWLPALRELARVLRPGGRLVLSTHHPFATVVPGEAYHAVRLVDDAWDGFAAAPVAVRYYHRPLERMVADLLEAGFALRGLHEPQPTVAMAERNAALAARFREAPGFLILDARLDGGAERA